jgi:hypothetical protein
VEKQFASVFDRHMAYVDTAPGGHPSGRTIVLLHGNPHRKEHSLVYGLRPAHPLRQELQHEDGVVAGEAGLVGSEPWPTIGGYLGPGAAGAGVLAE